MSLFAAPGSSTSIARTRSLRAPSKHPLTAAPQIERQQQTTAALNGNGGRGSPPGSGGSGSQIPSSTSNLALFLTNLRLLDLDLEPDWPDITPATFAARDAAGGQKKRIQAVEWTLYQLFVLWDPSEAHNKLRPFYPPADQVQSVNLRAALTRSLEATKKNGSLGRDTIIRKTMLDECKGERLEEVLAAFSSAVLKKLVAEKALNSGPEYYPTISEKLAVENRGYTGDRTELHGLLLAHKVSLAKSLAKKNEERARYQDFEELLSLKERTLARRREQVNVTAGDDGNAHVSDQARTQVRNVLRTNWTGNDRWIGTLLHGGADARTTGGLLDASFDEVWDGVRDGRLSDLEEKDGDLLGQLDQRVRAQKTRLEKWEIFHHKMFGAQKAAPVTPKKKAERPKRIIEFKSHANAHLSGQSQKYVDAKSEIPVEYEQVMLEMEQELGDVGKPKIPNFAKMFGSTSARLNTAALAPEPVQQEPISDISEWEDDPDLSPAPAPAPPPKPAHLAASRLALPKKTETALPRRNSVKTAPARQTSRRQKPSAKPRIEVHEPDEPVLEKPSQQELLEIYERTRKYMEDDDDFPSQSMSETQYHHLNTSYNPHSAEAAQRALSPLEPEIPIPTPGSPPPASPTRMAADEILAYMAEASPSPTKRNYKPRHTLSLADRTRMTMTRTQSFDADESDGGRLSPFKSNDVVIQEEPGHDTPAEDDLVERTRRSMAGFEAARQKAQLERRRSQRKSKASSPRKDSYFPRVQEEDGAAGGDGGEVGEISVMDELMMQEGAGEPDYEAVFKSRPKMRMSPAASPAPSRWREEEEDEEGM